MAITRKVTLMANDFTEGLEKRNFMQVLIGV